MKIALVHDYIKEYGGAERVLEALHEIWPDAPVFTTVYIPKFLGPHRERFKDWDIRTSFLQYLPFKEKLISPFRLIAPLIFRQFDFSKFDVVIVSSTGAYSPNGIKCHPERKRRISSQSSGDSSVVSLPQNDNGKGPIHVCYCHTPPRYLYGFATAREWKNNLFFRVLGEVANHFLRLVDFKSSQNVDFFIANSKNVAGRIEKFYRKKSVVIYPPVGGPVRSFPPASAPSTASVRAVGNPSTPATPYFLAGGRLARPKHIDLIVETFEKLDLPLVVFGREFAGSNNLKTQNSKLKSTAQNSKVEFVGEVSDKEKFELMAQAKAFIFAAEDEDFGITPVEAMSIGTPVIAYKSGGVIESIIEGKTGIFFDELKVGSLTMTINKFKTLKFDKDVIIEHAKKFSKERFKKEMKDFVNNKA